LTVYKRQIDIPNNTALFKKTNKQGEKMYKRPVAIHSDDPLCTATSLEGTVIGILFEKTGAEIKKAVESRIPSIDNEIARCVSTIKDMDEFLKGKNEEIKEIDKLYTERSDAREATAKPFNDDISVIVKKRDNIIFTFDKETDKKVASKATVFEEGFDKYNDSLKSIDEIMKELDSEGRVGLGMQGPSGTTGVSGSSGRIYSTPGVYARTINDSSSNEINTDNIDGESIRGIGFGDKLKELKLTEKETEAMSRLSTLRALVNNYSWKILKIKDRIKFLESEKRRLVLILKHIGEDRTYKLDMNKLSALGFEDVE
jgi:hypothetical protein